MNRADSLTTKQTLQPHIRAKINEDEQRGAEQTTQPWAPAQGNKASILLLKTPVGVGAAAGETPSLTGEDIGETHRGLECAQAHPLGPNLIVGSRGSD